MSCILNIKHRIIFYCNYTIFKIYDELINERIEGYYENHIQTCLI